MLIRGSNRFERAVIPYGRHELTDEDVEAVERVLRGASLTQGPAVPVFEEAIARYCGAAYGVAANSATSCLQLACLALGVGPGDRVWTSPVTFVATAAAAMHCGASVGFVDIDPVSWNLDAGLLAGRLAQAQRDGALPKVLIVVHLAGQPCDMPAISALARQYGVRVIEDAAHALGAECDGHPVGRCAHSDITVFSFHPVKSITTGEGGMAVTNDAGLAEHMGLLRAHGRDQRGEQIVPGFNFRMTDIGAALGLSQLARLGEVIARRAALAAHYDEAFRGAHFQLQGRRDGDRSAHHLYIVRTDAARRAALVDSLSDAGITTALHYRPVHLQPVFRSAGHTDGDFPEAERYAREAVTIPLFPTLPPADQQRVIEVCLA